MAATAAAAVAESPQQRVPAAVIGAVAAQCNEDQDIVAGATAKHVKAAR